ncbi:hypothetical protein [Streptomyces albipurpureus]|uniref:Secreted protein n=1 Tax=Streptomyces albipurpureus TaxID=2897419 RepID=A0ABT0UGW7_9ACTN|nr:hypothetical protein [Streptomyces sp. CWNU-1]MCM2387693.1 hypothetical protein [Streptomyces sp. CWNU-1]
MPLHALPAPAPVLRSVLAALGSPAAVSEDRTPALRSVQGPVSPESPLPVHVLDHISPTPSTPATRLIGWRVLIRADERYVAAAETRLTTDGWAFSHFFEGPYISSTERALRQAESMKTPFQPRLLSIPALYMFTLWLHGDTEADAASGTPQPTDVLVPLAPAPPGIAAHRPHQVAELLPMMTSRLAPPPLLASPA